MEKSKFKIEIQIVGFGWLAVLLEYGDEKYEFSPSFVPYDSIYELTMSVYRIITNFDEATSHWNDEPIEHEINLIKSNDLYFLEVIRVSEGTFGLDKTKIFQAKGSLKELIKPIWRALRKLESVKGYAESIRYPFPKSELKKITEIFKNK